MAKLSFCSFCAFICFWTARSIESQLFENIETTTARIISQHIDSQKQAIGFLLNIDPDINLAKLFPAISAANQSRLDLCYNQSVSDGLRFNVFDNTFFDVVQGYYVRIFFEVFFFIFDFLVFLNY